MKSCSILFSTGFHGGKIPVTRTGRWFATFCVTRSCLDWRRSTRGSLRLCAERPRCLRQRRIVPIRKPAKRCWLPAGEGIARGRKRGPWPAADSSRAGPSGSSDRQVFDMAAFRGLNVADQRATLRTAGLCLGLTSARISFDAIERLRHDAAGGRARRRTVHMGRWRDADARCQLLQPAPRRRDALCSRSSLSRL